MRTVKLRLVAVTTALLLVSAGLIGTAAAGHVMCGDTITQDTTLDSDVGPCLGPTSGIVIGSDGVTLDLNGHEVIGDPNLDGEGAQGIIIENRQAVTVTSSQPGGTVRDFDAGVNISGSSNVTIKNIAARDNIGSSSSAFGDGIVLFNSPDNLIKNNEVDHNGPFDGIGVVGAGSTGNTVESNTVVNNDIPSSATVNQDDGIRLEPDTTKNIVRNNTVIDNGLDGIAVFADSTGNTLQGNEVRHNGYHDKAHRKGDGIRVFERGNDTTINTTPSNDVPNKVFDNAANGIRVDSHNNEIRDNKTGENGEAPTLEKEVGPLTVTVDTRAHLKIAGEETQHPAPAYDLHDGNTDSDGNPTCDNNTWADNTFDTAFPECTKS